MKWVMDGDHIRITRDDFVDLMESPAVFIPADSEDGRRIQRDGLLGLPVESLRNIRDQLVAQEIRSAVSAVLKTFAAEGK